MNWSGRYLSRLLLRNFGRSFLSLLLAALLAFAFGTLTVLRGIYTELYQNVEVKADFSGGLSYRRALKIAESGYVRNPYYEYTAQDAMVEMEKATIILTNRLDKLVTEPVVWLPGWDEETALNTKERILILYSTHADKFGLQLGDMVRVNELDWWNNVTSMGLDPLKPGESDMDRRDARRPFVPLVGIIRTENPREIAFMPAEAWQKVLFLVGANFQLDLAEYTLNDYHKAAEFTAYAKGELEKEQTAVRFKMDTSYADRIYKIHQLIETLYPLTIAAALFLGGVLPGLTVLHASRQISVLRALGAKVGKCVGIYTLAQLLCALFGLVLGFLMVILTQHPEIPTVWKPFGIYLAAHLAVCALGSGVFAWLCARKRVLEQLQAKE